MGVDSCVPFGKPDDGIGRYRHCPQLLFFVVRLWIVQEVQLMKILLDLRLQIHEPLAIDDITQRSVSRRALLHEFRKDSCFIRILPLWGHFLENHLAHRAPTPVRDHLFLLRSAHFVIYFIRDLLAFIEDFEVVHRVATNLRKCRRTLWARATLAHDQFAVTDPNILALH